MRPGSQTGATGFSIHCDRYLSSEKRTLQVRRNRRVSPSGSMRYGVTAFGTGVKMSRRWIRRVVAPVRRGAGTTAPRSWPCYTSTAVSRERLVAVANRELDTGRDRSWRHTTEAATPLYECRGTRPGGARHRIASAVASGGKVEVPRHATAGTTSSGCRCRSVEGRPRQWSPGRWCKRWSRRRHRSSPTALDAILQVSTGAEGAGGNNVGGDWAS